MKLINLSQRNVFQISIKSTFFTVIMEGYSGKVLLQNHHFNQRFNGIYKHSGKVLLGLDKYVTC